MSCRALLFLIVPFLIFSRKCFKFYIAKLAKLDVYFPLFRNPKNQASPDFRAH